MVLRKAAQLITSYTPFLSLSVLVSASIVQADAPQRRVCFAARHALQGLPSTDGLSKWLLIGSDAQVLQKAQFAYGTIYDAYNVAICTVERDHDMRSLDEYTWRSVVSDATEEMLYQLATDMFYDQCTSQSYLDDLKESLAILELYQDCLAKSIRSLEARSQLAPEKHRLLVDMQQQLGILTQGAWHVALLRDCLRQHRDYFSLYECEARINNAFGKEIAIVRDNQADEYRLKNALKRHVLRSYTDGRQRHPLMAYVACLQKAVDDLDNFIIDAGVRYHDRVAWADRLLDNLTYIKDVMVHDSAYQDEARDQNTGHWRN